MSAKSEELMVKIKGNLEEKTSTQFHKYRHVVEKSPSVKARPPDHENINTDDPSNSRGV